MLKKVEKGLAALRAIVHASGVGRDAGRNNGETRMATECDQYIRYHVPADTMGEASEEQHDRFCERLAGRVIAVYPGAEVDVRREYGINMAHGFEPLRDDEVLERVFWVAHRLFDSGDWVEA